MAFLPDYRQQPVETLLVDPRDIHVVATYSTTGPVWTVSTAARRSHPGSAIAVAGAGDYDVSGLEKGGAYVVLGCELLPPTGVQAVCVATVEAASLDPSAGTLTINTRTTGGTPGTLTAPADGTELHLTLRVEPAVYV